MNRFTFVFLLLLFSLSNGFCSSKWDSSLISDSLKKNADAVIREFSILYNRKSIDKYEKQVYCVATILNNGGTSIGEILINYDQNSEVNDMKINIYDKSGNLIKKVKKNEIQDYAYNNSYTLFSDNRVKYYNASSNFYPYTVEFSYTVNYDGFVGVQPWIPIDAYDVSTENAELIFKTPSEFDIKYKELNHEFELSQTEEEGLKTYHWTANNIKAIKYQVKSADYLEVFPTVIISPGKIFYEGTAGDFSSWESYGKWVYSLIKSRDKLPEETILKIKQLTDTIPSKIEKIKAVYKYMQSKTRYVNIAYGLGGFQPILAETVDEKGYGDCKALSNYTKALLKCINIDAYYTEIGSGSSQLIKYPDFPTANQTNHVIVCVPLEKDTVWLECTSQNAPFGYIYGSNSNRWALLVKEDGGQLVRTPTYKTHANKRSSSITTEIDSNGNAKTQLKTRYENYKYEEILSTLLSSPKEQKKALLKAITANSLEISDYELKDETIDIPRASINMNCTINTYAQKTGSRFFIQPNFLWKNSFASNIPDDRDATYYQNIGFCYDDSLTISFPKNMEIEYLPKDMEVSSTYGTYSIHFIPNENDRLLVKRFVEIKSGKYTPETLKEIDVFLNIINKQKKAKIILKKSS